MGSTIAGACIVIQMVSFRLASLAGWLVLIDFVLLSMGAAVSAQENESAEFVAAIYEGSCDDPNLSSQHPLPEDATGFGHSDNQHSLAFSTSIEIPLTEFLAVPHALVVDQRSGELATPFSCITISNLANEERVLVGMPTIDTGQLVGVAHISDTDENRTSVVIFLVVNTEGQPLGGTSVVAGEDSGLDTERVDDSSDSEVAPDEGDSPEGGV